MMPEKWQQVDQLFHSALAREPKERAAFLDQACNGDTELRREVESLLAAEAEAESTTKALPARVAAEMLANERGEIVAGQHIGHYRILSPLGAGGMGEVYLAQDTHLGRKVALKFLPAGITANEDARRRFTREARAASALAHPHICTIHEIGEDNGRRFIVMEYVEGETLAAKLKQARLSVAECLVFATQITDALAEAHDAGIIHRDIKPANIVITSRGQAKVLDFGLAKFLRKDELRDEGGGMKDESEQGTLIHPSSLIPHPSTLPGIVMGTVPYMSPEQVRGESLDARTDIFSVGTMLYEMLSGRQPFARRSAAETMSAILTEEPSPLGEVAPEIERVVRRCLAKVREQRYPSARALLHDLAQLKAGDSTATQAVPTAPQIQMPPMQEGSIAVPRKRYARGLGVAALVIVGLMAVLVAWQMSRGAAVSAIKSLAVLPPRALQAAGRDEALEMGTASMLITRLSSLRQLIVRSETAVEKYARPDQDPLAAGREQEVDAVLDSRYQRSGDKLRFTLRLLRVADGATLWAATLDQPTADLFALQDALSAKVTTGLKLTLNEAEKELLAKRYTRSAEAWQLYAQGRQLVHTRQIPNIEKAIIYFERAIALDPGFALAQTFLGFAYVSLNYLGHSPATEVMPKAKAAYDQALKLDEQLAEAHSLLAQYKEFYEWDFSRAEQLHQRALALNPNSSDVHHHYAIHLMHLVRFEPAIAEMRKAEELDPTDGFFLRNVAQVLFFARRYDEAIEQSRRAIDLNPNSGPMYNWMIRGYEMKGDEEATFAAILKQAEASGAGLDEIAGMKAAHAASGLKGYWRMELDRQLAREKSRYIGRPSVPMLYARLGDKEQALTWLQRAIDARNLNLSAIHIDPIWDAYRSDPRFMALVRRIGLKP